MMTVNNSVQRGLHQQISSEVISATQIIENDEIHQALIDMLQHGKNINEVKQRHQLRMLLAERIFPQHYGGFYVIGKNQTIIASMKERDTGMDIPEASRIAVKRLEEGEPSVVTHAFMFHEKIHMWLLKPVKDRDGGIVGYFALELGGEHRFSVTTLSIGMSYDSGETYLIDAQGRLLSTSRFQADLVRIGALSRTQSSVLNIKVMNPGLNLLQQQKPELSLFPKGLTAAAKQVVTSHKTGWNLEGYRDYRGVLSIGVWQWDDYLDAAIITEMDRDEAMRDYIYTRNLLLIVLLIVLLASLISVVEHGRLRVRLQREEHQYKDLLLDSTAEAIYGLDLQGNCTFVNETFQTLMGYRKDEMLGKNMHELIHYADIDGKAYPEALCPIVNVPVDCRHIHKKKEVFWHKAGNSIKVEYWAQPLFEAGQVSGSVVSFIEYNDGVSHDTASKNIAKPLQSTLRFEKLQGHENTPHEPVDAVVDMTTAMVLVVDDDEMVREVSCAMLKDLAFQVMVAEDGQQGLDLYREHQAHICCVLTDLTMPRMDGKELLIQLRNINAACRVIVCSGYSSEYASEQFVQQDVSAFLQKPYSKDDLRSVLAHVLGVDV